MRTFKSNKRGTVGGHRDIPLRAGEIRPYTEAGDIADPVKYDGAGWPVREGDGFPLMVGKHRFLLTCEQIAGGRKSALFVSDGCLRNGEHMLIELPIEELVVDIGSKRIMPSTKVKEQELLEKTKDLVEI